MTACRQRTASACVATFWIGGSMLFGQDFADSGTEHINIFLISEYSRFLVNIRFEVHVNIQFRLLEFELNI